MAPCSPKHLSPLTAGYKRKTIIEPFKIPPAKHSKTLDNADLSEKFCAKSPVFERTALRKALTDPIRASPEPAAGFKRKTIEPFNLPPAKHSKTEDRGDLSEKFCAKSPVFEKAALRDAVTDTIRATPEPTAPVTEASLVREDCTAGRDALAALREKHLLKRYADNSDTPSLAHATTLTKLRDNPVRFVPATHLTLDDERRLLGEFYLVRTPPPEQPLDQRSEQLPVQPPVKPQKQAPVQEAKMSISSKWPSSTPSRPQGLRNPGALCYRLGVFQALLHLPMFVNWLELHNCNSDTCLACRLKFLAKAYWHQPSRVNQSLNQLNEVVKVIGRRSIPRWLSVSPFEQADAHEFMAWILEILQNRHNLPAKVMEGMFKIQHQATWKCDDCGHVHRGPAIDDLGLQLQIVTPRPHLHIGQYIDQYYNDLVQDAKCEKCKSKKNRDRPISINTAPEVLIIQLRRFEMTRAGVRRKLTSKVSFEERLDLSRYAADPLVRKSKGIQYKLSSVVQHSGTLSSGHYVSIAESPGGLFKLNDERVTMASKADMLYGSGSFTPYILTYMKCT